MATTYQMSKGSSKSHKSLEPTKEQAKNYVDKVTPKERQQAINMVNAVANDHNTGISMIKAYRRAKAAAKAAQRVAKSDKKYNQ